MANVIEALYGEGFVNVKVDSFDNHATYLEGELDGQQFEIKTHLSEYDYEFTEVHARIKGAEDWQLMFDLEREVHEV